MHDTRPTCFVIMPFTTPEGYEPQHFKKIYEQIFVPAIKLAGFTPLRCDEITNSCTQYDNMFFHLDTAPIVLCDASTYNPNVMYELGIRHYHNKPTVIVQEENQKHIFDLRPFNIIPYRNKRLYDEVIADQKAIANALTSTYNQNTPQAQSKLDNKPHPNISPPLRGIRELNVRGAFVNYAPSYPIETDIPQLASQAYDILQQIFKQRRFIKDELLSEPTNPQKRNLLIGYLDQLEFALKYAKTTYKDDFYIDVENLFHLIQKTLEETQTLFSS